MHISILASTMMSNGLMSICQSLILLIQWYLALEFSPTPISTAFVNFYIDMTKPNRDMVILDELLLDGVNKKDMADYNETFEQPNDFSEVEYNADVAPILLEIQVNKQIDDNMNNQLSNGISDDSGDSSDAS